MKRVHTPQMVAHLWANQSQEEARNSSGNFYFNGRTIYSYGSNFPIATIHQRGKGEKKKSIVLFNAASYSKTTARHQSLVHLAAQHLTQVRVANVRAVFSDGPPAHKPNLVFFQKEIDETAAKALRARKSTEWLWRQVESLVADANTYCEFFGLRRRFAPPLPEAIREKVKAQRKQAAIDAKKKAERRAQLIKAREEHERERAAQYALDLERWKAGAAIELPYRREGDASLRVQGDTLETSLGEEVPLSHAVRLLQTIRSGVPYEHNGHSLHVGQFRVDRIDSEGNVKAGCHDIKRAEIERIAAQLGL